LSSSVRRFCACAAVALPLLFAASPAIASPETLKRAMGNILFAPVDIALSPIVAAHTIYHNLNDIGDSVGVRLAYPVPGYAWTTGLTIGAGALRERGYGPELRPMQSIGYRHMTPVAEGRDTLANALVAMRRDTRRFARRQRTWLRGVPEAVWLAPADADRIFGLVEAFIRTKNPQVDQ